MGADDMDTSRAFFENEDWTVLAEGLEHRGTRYLIEREQIGRRHGDGFWAWPLHMLEKNWVAPQTFAEAFSAAVRLFGLRMDDDSLALTFADAGWVKAASGWQRRTAEIVPHPALSASNGIPVGQRVVARTDRQGVERRRRPG